MTGNASNVEGPLDFGPHLSGVGGGLMCLSVVVRSIVADAEAEVALGGV